MRYLSRDMRRLMNKLIFIPILQCKVFKLKCVTVFCFIGDGSIVFAEFRKMAPGLQRDKIFAHCKRGWCGICIGK